MAKIQIKNSFITSSAQITISSSLVRFSDSIRAKGITGSFSGSFAGSNLFVQGGNSFGNTALLGTNDNQPLALETNGSEKLRITAAGNVGIGTSNPIAKLHTVGSNGSTDYVYQQWSYTSNVGVYDLILKQTVTSNVVRYNFSMNNASTAYNDVLVLDRGCVGIGTSFPLSKLDVRGTMYVNYGSNGTGYIQTNGTDSDLQITTATNLTTLMNTGGSAGLAFGAGNSERMRITSGGNLGIGTTSGTFTLNVYNNADVWHARFGSAAGELRIGGETSSGAVIQSFVPGSGTVRNLYIQRDGGNVGIGTTTTSYKLTVNGDLAFNGGLSTRMLVSYTNLTNGEDWANSPISIRERDQVGNTQLADKYAPNLNFHWANRASKSVWMDANGMLNWGEYDASGIPAADGTFKTAILLATSNVGIGTTSPTQRLEVAGIAMAGQGSYRTSIYGDNGGAYLYFGTTANTSVLGTIGAYGAAFNINSTNGDTLFLYNSSEKMRITTGGNVGIGTTAPLSLLDVRSGFITAGTNSATAGTTIIAGYYTSGYLTSLGTEFSSGGPVLGYAVSPSTSGTGAFLSSTTITIPRSAYVQDGGTHRWYTGAAQSVAIGSAVTTSEKMRMDTNGNIGIGTSSPSDKLDINGNLYFSKASDPRIYANTGVGLNIDGQALWLNRNTNASIIMATGGGNVGIGTTSPTAKLQVGTQMYGSAPDANYFVVGNENFTGPGPVGGISGYPVTANKSQVTASLFDVIGGWERINASHALLRVSAYDVVNSTPALTVLNNGNVGMGTNSPASRLQLGNLSSTQTSVPETLSLGGTYSNSAGANVKLRVYEDGGGGAIGGMSVSSGQMEVNTWSAGKIAFYRGTTQSAIIDANGNLGIGTSSPRVLLDLAKANNVGQVLLIGETSTNTRVGFGLDSATAGMRIFTANIASETINLGGISTSDGTTWTRNHSFGIAGKNSWLNEQGGNVGIGTTSPTAKFQVGTHSIGDAGNGDNSANVRIGAASAGSRVYGMTLANTATATLSNESALSFIVAGNYSATGIISAVLRNTGNAATDLIFTNYSGGLQERMRILYDGNVGIGTTSPAHRLQLGSITSTSTATPETLSLAGSYSSTAGSNPKLRVWTDGTYSMGLGVSGDQLDYILGRSIYDHVFYAEGSRLMTIKGGGNVGIGTSSPAYKLDVNGPIGVVGLRFVDQSTSYFRIFEPAGNIAIYLGNAADPANYYDNGTHFFRNRGGSSTYAVIEGNGNLGIGTTSVTEAVHVYRAANSIIRMQAGGGDVSGIRMDDASSSGYLLKNRSSQTTNNALAGALYTYTDNNRAFQHIHNGTPLFTILSGGNIGIGTTSPLAKLSIGNGSLADGNLPVQISSAGTNTERYFGINKNGTYGLIVGYYEGSSFSGVGAYIRQVTSDPIHFLVNNNVTAMSMISSGNVGIGTTKPTGSLHVYQAVGVGETAIATIQEGAGGAAELVFRSGNASTNRRGALRFYSNQVSSTTAQWTVGTSMSQTSGDNSFYFYNNGSTSVLTLSQTNVGIGSTAPAYKLDVNGTFRSTGDLWTNGNIIINRAGAYLYINGTNSDSEIVWQANGSNRWAAGMNVGDATENFNVYNYTTATTNFTILKANGNVGIGSATPAYKLDVNGGVNINGVLSVAGVAVLNEESNANDIYANIRVIRNRSSTLNDGMYINYNSTGTTAAHLRFYANAQNERMRIQANDGHVGIGTSIAAGRLDVYDSTDAGHVAFVRNASTGTSAYSAIVLRRNGDANGIVLFTNSSNRTTDGGAGNSTIRTDNGNLLLGAGGSSQHILTTAGSVGIGTTTVESGCLVTFKASNTARLSITDGSTRAHLWPTGGNFYFSTETASDIVIITNATERMRITSAGNVGIGTTSPGSKLDVNGTFRTAINNLTIFNDYLYVSPTENNTLNSAYFTNGIADMWINYAGYNNGNTQFRNFNVGNGKNSNIAWFDGTNKRLSINNGQTANYTLDVNGTLNATGTSTLAGVSITGTINSSTTEVVRINNNNGYISFYNTAGTTRTGYLQGNTGNAMLLASENNSIIQFSVGGSEVARISTSGNVGIGTTSPSTKFSIIGTMSSVSINAQRQYTYSAIGSTNDDIWFRSSTSFANNGAAASLNLARLTYQSAGTGNDLTDKVGIWLRGFYDNSAGGLPIYLGGYAYSSQIPAVTITALNADGMGGNLGIGTTAPLSKLNSYGSGSNLSLFRVDGGNGTLFEVTDQLSGSLFSVNDVSGLPLLEVFSNNRVVAGKYGTNALVVSGSSVGIGTSRPAYKLQVSGSFAATTKSFVIKHPDPAKSDKQLIHGVTEGPEHSVFVRGKLLNDNIIVLPDYWQHLVHEESITITLTPNKYYQQLYVKSVTDTTIEVGTETDKPINCYYYVVGERKDIPKLITEI